MAEWISKTDILAQQIAREREKVRRPAFQPAVTPPFTPQVFPGPEEIEEPIYRQPLQERLQIPSWAITPEDPERRELPSLPIIQEREIPWYEQPKALTERFMSGIAKGIEKVPFAPEVLEKVSPVFEFIHEKLEKPWSAAITAPLSPTLPYRAGEDWMEHQKREYETWKAPAYIKGVAEFAMPLWWLPYFGWATKGAKALAAGTKVTKTLKTVSKGKLALPSKEMLNASYKVDPMRKFAWWAENKPGLNRVVKFLGGERSFVRPESIDPIDIARRELLNRAQLISMKEGAKGILLPRLQVYGDPVKLLNISDNGIARGVVARGTMGKELGLGISEVIEHPQYYRFATKEQELFVKEIRKIIREVRVLARKEGVKLPKGILYHRIVKGKILTPELEKKLGAKLEPSEYGSRFEMARHHKTMESGIQSGVLYGNNPLESVMSTIDHYVKKIADKRFTDEVGKLGDTPMGKFASQFPDEAARITELTTQRMSAQLTKDVIQRVMSYDAGRIPPATMSKIRAISPDVAARIDDVFSIVPNDIDGMVSAIGREALRAARIKPKEFKDILSQYTRDGRIRLGDISEAIHQWNVTESVAQKAITKIYKQAYNANKKQFDDTLGLLRNEMDDVISKTIKERHPLLAERVKFLKQYEGRQALGLMEAKFRSHPVFKNQFFPKGVVEVSERVLGEQGQKWVSNMAQASGTARMLVASLDFSAPFIQGLALLGRNPVAWVGAVGKQFEFFIRPRNMYKYMISPEASAIRAERVLYGGSASTFEFFEALKPLQRVVGKVPVAGEWGQKLIGQTYGRAEAAFTGFGEVARNEIWKALRRPNMTDDQLRELSRTVDRMTGVMSTEALGIGIAQRDVESAFMFFAPRYTRASLAFVADVFKGGMVGAEARKAISALMVSGVAMYSGVCATLGQTPEFNPRSAKFMTIKIGDDRVGIGGILYGLMRLGAGIAVTAAEEPEDLFQPFKAGALNRFDNPFLRFMYQRTSPLTGLGIGVVVEQKNYFGEPFETPADWGRFLAEKVTPIAMQRVVPWEERKVTAPVFLSEVAGGRTFPKSAWELREEARDRIAQEQFGQNYEGLPKLQQNEIDKSPEIEALQEEADVRTEQIGGLSFGFLKWREERDSARQAYIRELEMAQKAVDVGVQTPYDFKGRLQDAGKGLGTTYEHINANPEYKEVMAKLDEPDDISKEYIGDIVYDLLQQARASFEDEYGIFNYDAYDGFKEKLSQTYGEDAMDYAEDLIQQKRDDLPPLAQEYFLAQEVLKPYWNVQSDVERIFGEAKNPSQQRRIDTVVSRIRKRMRMTDPEVAKYYNLFYAR